MAQCLGRFRCLTPSARTTFPRELAVEGVSVLSPAARVRPDGPHAVSVRAGAGAAAKYFCGWVPTHALKSVVGESATSVSASWRRTRRPLGAAFFLGFSCCSVTPRPCGAMGGERSPRTSCICLAGSFSGDLQRFSFGGGTFALRLRHPLMSSDGVVDRACARRVSRFSRVPARGLLLPASARVGAARPSARSRGPPCCRVGAAVVLA
jgi:hypothetical protein